MLQLSVVRATGARLPPSQGCRVGRDGRLIRREGGKLQGGLNILHPWVQGVVRPPFLASSAARGLVRCPVYHPPLELVPPLLSLPSRPSLARTVPPLCGSENSGVPGIGPVLSVPVSAQVTAHCAVKVPPCWNRPQWRFRELCLVLCHCGTVAGCVPLPSLLLPQPHCLPGLPLSSSLSWARLAPMPRAHAALLPTAGQWQLLHLHGERRPRPLWQQAHCRAVLRPEAHQHQQVCGSLALHQGCWPHLAAGDGDTLLLFTS